MCVHMVWMQDWHRGCELPHVPDVPRHDRGSGVIYASSMHKYIMETCTMCNCAVYQAAIWKSSMQQFSLSPNPVSFDWELRGGKQCLVIEWMNGDPAPVAILEKSYCTCKRVCK